MTLEDIGDGDDALFCVTDQPACCRPPYSDATGNWFFPNGTGVPSTGNRWDLYRTRGQSVVFMHRRRGGEDGIYNCVVPDAMNVNQTIYIGVYSADAGECYVGVYILLLCSTIVSLKLVQEDEIQANVILVPKENVNKQRCLQFQVSMS